jgi:hypothetical protein
MRYKRDDRVVVVSQDEQSNWASNLLRLLHPQSSSSNNVLLKFTIAKKEEDYDRILSIMLALDVRAVVLKLEKNLALHLMSEAEEYGFVDVDCIWIFEHSIEGSKRMPLLGKLVGVSFNHYNGAQAWRNALRKDSVNILEKTFQNINISNTDFEISSSSEHCRSSTHWLSGKSFYK